MVEVYGTEVCLPCKNTKRVLNKLGIPFDYYDVEKDDHALEYVKSLGYEGIPVIVVGEEHFQGFQPDRLKALV